MQWRLWKRLCQATQLFIQSNCVSQVRHWFVRAFWWDRTPVPDSAVYGGLNPESSSQELFRGARGLSPRNHCSKGQPTRCLSPSKYKIVLATWQHGNLQADFQLWRHATTQHNQSGSHPRPSWEEDASMNNCAFRLSFPPWQSKHDKYSKLQTHYHWTQYA